MIARSLSRRSQSEEWRISVKLMFSNCVPMVVVKSNCLKGSKAPDSFNGMKGADLEATASTLLKTWKALGACV